MENWTTFKIKTECYLQNLASETMKLLGSTKIKITKDENGENVPQLDITELKLVHYIIVKNNYQQVSTVLYTFVPNKLFSQSTGISSKILYLWKHLFPSFFILKYGLLIKTKWLEIEDKINITLIIY